MSVVPCLPAHLCVSPQRPVAGPPRERVTTLANSSATDTIIHSGAHATLTTNITTTPPGSGLAGNRTAERARHHPHALPTRVVHGSATRPPPASPDRACAPAHCWEDNYDVLPAIRHLLAATALRPQAHQQPTEPQEPDHPMPPRSISPASTAGQNAEHQREEPDPDRAATPSPPPPQRTSTPHWPAP